MNLRGMKKASPPDTMAALLNRGDGMNLKDTKKRTGHLDIRWPLHNPGSGFIELGFYSPVPLAHN